MEPVALTSTGSVSNVQVLCQARIIYTQSSLTSPNDVYIIRNLDEPDKPLEFEQITNFTEDQLKEKEIGHPEEFWFEGALGRQIQGWVHSPPGAKRSDEKSWPAILMIHGGPQSSWDDSWSTRWNPECTFLWLDEKLVF